MVSGRSVAPFSKGLLQSWFVNRGIPNLESQLLHYWQFASNRFRCCCQFNHSECLLQCLVFLVYKSWNSKSGISILTCLLAIFLRKRVGCCCQLNLIEDCHFIQFIHQTQSEARDATEEEENNSPHGSFRKVGSSMPLALIVTI